MKKILFIIFFSMMSIVLMTSALSSMFHSVPCTESVHPESGQPVKDWKIAAVNDLFLFGKISQKEVEQFKKNEKLPANWMIIERNDLGMIIGTTDNKEKGKGIRLLSLIDRHTNTVLSASESVPLFTVELLDKATGKTVSIHSEDGWKTVEVDRKSEQFMFTGAYLPGGEKLSIVLKTLKGQSESRHGIDWHWQVRQGVDRYEFRKLNCPQISLRNLGPTMKAFYWYDAALIYRLWVKNEANWYPRQKLGSNGRTDTPQWMKELCVWAVGADWSDSLQTTLKKTPEKMKKFNDALGIPTGLHLYNWHQIPFDNDYPH